MTSLMARICVLMRGLFLIRFESGWKAVLAYTDGVILVYDPDSAGQDQQLSLWFDYFVKRNGLRDEQCLIFAHRTGNSTDKFKPRTSPCHLPLFNVHFDQCCDIHLFLHSSFILQGFCCPNRAEQCPGHQVHVPELPARHLLHPAAEIDVCCHKKVVGLREC